MSESPESRDSENNWVIPSAESFPVETVGAAHGGVEDAGAAGSEPTPPADSEETAPPPDVKPGTELGEGPKHQEPLHTEKPERPDEDQGPPPDAESPGGPSTVASCFQKLAQLIPEPLSLGVLRTWGQQSASETGGDLEEVSCSSSDEEVEGLRKRVGHGAPPVSVGSSVREAPQQDADAGSSLNLNTLVIAAIGLICVGLLVFSGGSFSSDDDAPQTVMSRSVKEGEKQPPQVITDIQDWIEQHADQFTGDPSSLQVMSGLLDKVAKENQEIRHMQAKLQAQKEELEALLSVSDGGTVTPGTPLPVLTEENVRLKDALLKEETAHLSAKEELQNIQEKLEVLETSGVDKEALVVENAQMKVELDALRRQIEGFLAQKETLVAESQMLRQELDKQRLLVTTMRQDLENLVKGSEGEDEKLLQERLSEMSSRLAMEAQRSETWEKTYVEHAQRRKEQVGDERRDHSRKEWKKSSKTSDFSIPGEDIRKTHYKHGKEHGKRWAEESPRESQHEEWRSKKHEDKHVRDKKHRNWEGEKAGAEIPEDKQTWKSKAKEHWSRDSVHHHHDHPEKQARHHQGEAGEGFHPRKGQKDFRDSHKRREDSEKAKDHRHHDHNKFWKKLSDHQYRVPEGCSGLEDCARKDGVDLFNVELKPVQRKQFEEVLLNYLTKSQLSEHLPELVPLLDGFFEGPLFSHHKIRFKDFVDDLEDFLEDLARKETGNDDIVDDFERYVYTNFFGEATTKRRFAKKDEQQKKNKHHKHSGKLEKSNDQGLNQSDDNKPFRTNPHADSRDFKPIEKHKPWSLNTHYEEESADKHNPKTHHRSSKHKDENGVSIHHHHDGHHSGKKPKYPHTKPGGEAGVHHHDGHHFHKQYKEDGDWQEQRHNKHNYDPENHRPKNTYKEHKSPDDRFGKDSYKNKHKNADKYKDDVEHNHYPRKHEKDANNKHYQLSQRHESHRQDDWSPDHKPRKDDHEHRQHHHQQDDHEDRHGNYHQKHGKDKHYHQKYEQAKDRDYHHKHDKGHHKHEEVKDYHHKRDRDQHKHDDDKDYQHKLDKDHHKYKEGKDKRGNYDYRHDEERRQRDCHEDPHNPPKKY